jgi:polysaccharide export outer membrane protein
MKKWLGTVAALITVSMWSVLATAAWAQGSTAAPPPAPAAAVPPPQAQAPASPLPAAPSPNYVLGPNDRIRVRAIGADDISGEYVLNGDGTFNYSYLGEVKAAGLTVSDLEGYLRKTLIDKGFYKDPQISIAILEYRSKRVHVIGAVARQGTLALTGDMGIIEALAAAGGTTANASDYVLLVRSQGGTSGPVRPGEDKTASEVRYDLAPLRAGKQSTATFLNDGDTMVVPELDRVTVSGFVRSPNQYEVRRDTTVREALTLAGGVSELGAENRIEIIREENGKKQTIKNVKMEDLVKPNDVIVVPQRRL